MATNGTDNQQHCLTTFPCRAGYVALLSVLIVSVIAATTVAVLFTTSLDTTLNSGNITDAKIARALADACAEKALLQLRTGTSTPCTGLCETAQTFTTGTCKIIDITSSDQQHWTIQTTGSGVTRRITKYIQVEAYRLSAGSAPAVLQWVETTEW